MMDPFPIEHASAYDREFSFSRIGLAQRRLVWRYLEPLLSSPGQHVLELNCGTGIDAVHLARHGQRVLATDISEEMLKVARGTARQHGLEHLITHERMAFDEIASRGWQGRFQLVLSDMGGSNYLAPEALADLCHPLADALVPNGRFVAVLMPDRCIAETLYHFLHGNWGEAFRRGRHDPVWSGLSGSGAHIWYHRPSAFARAFDARFRVVNIRPIGFFVPPAFVEDGFTPGSKTLSNLMRWDERIGRWRWTARYADHFLIDLERRS